MLPGVVVSESLCIEIHAMLLQITFLLFVPFKSQLGDDTDFIKDRKVYIIQIFNVQRGHGFERGEQLVFSVNFLEQIHELVFCYINFPKIHF